jgi:enamine deaminase RidA (YjgF/YER057c/UK114 family)
MKPAPVAAQRIEVSSHPVAETIESHGCLIVLRRVEGPDARELFIHCRPPAGTAEAGRQADPIYRAILGVLEAEGGDFGSVVSEMVFLRDLPENIHSVRESRRRVLSAGEKTTHGPATIEIEQPPLNEHACLEVLVQAILPQESRPRFEPVVVTPACDCAECARARGLRVRVGDEVRFQAAGLCGAGEGAYEQTLGMFGLAERMLQQAGMAFSDVVRTWIHLRDIDRDYGDLNRARRAFFEARNIDPVPASTGIGGGPVPAGHDLCLGVYAVKAGRPLERTVMTSPTLNEAMQYGADFVRGMRVVEANKVALLVSGTASIDEHGRTAHPGDFDAQADRMLVNVAALLKGQGARYGDVVSAITYVKHPEDAERLRAKLREAGFEGFPHALVVAPICRPDLLCETEALAVLPMSIANRDISTSRRAPGRR